MAIQKTTRERDSLPFVGKKTCWKVKPLGCALRDKEQGKKYGEAYLHYLKTTRDECVLPLGRITDDMYDRGKPELRRKEIWIRIGFLEVVSRNLGADQYHDRPLDRLRDAYERLPDIFKPSAHAFIDVSQQHDASLQHKTSGNVITVDFRPKQNNTTPAA